jgi:hypothetical protein
MRLYSKKPFITILVAFLTLFGLSSSALASVISLAWDPNPPEDQVAGYIVYYGTASGRYTHTAIVENATTCTLTGLTPEVTYYIAVTAYDEFDNESDFSDEVSGKGRPVPPIVSLQINNGAGDTLTRTVTLNNTAINGATHYKASESPSFAGKIWLAYKGAPKFTLSTGGGTKTVYFKAKNMDGESAVVTDTIELKGPQVSSFQINSGAATAASRTVTLDNIAINGPTYYKASESLNFAGKMWLAYKGAPKFTLSAGSGPKTVYFKVKNSVGESPVVSDTITLEGPTVSSFDINGGAASTTSRTVTLNNTAINSPTQYKASESSDFKGKLWLTYKEAPKFTLSAGAGSKTVYFKVKNSVGESIAMNDTINLE